MQQQSAGQQLRTLEDKYYNALRKNLEIDAACQSIDEEIETLEAKISKLEKQTQQQQDGEQQPAANGIAAEQQPQQQQQQEGDANGDAAQQEQQREHAGDVAKSDTGPMPMES